MGYIIVTAFVAVAALAWSGLHWGWPEALPLTALVLLALLGWWAGTAVVESGVFLSFSSIVLLAAVVIVGPAGAGVVGLAMAGLQRERVPTRARVFNTAMTSVVGVAGGVAYLLAGGATEASSLRGAGSLVREIGVPLLIADVVIVLLNAALIAGVTWFSQGMPYLLQMRALLSTTGPVYVGYGVLAFVLIVLWLPAGLGWLSVLLIVAPLAGARWAILQRAGQREAQERTLEALVAAVETKAPELAGHSARVARLSGRMAEALGLPPREVLEARRAARLHDLGLVTLPTGRIRVSTTAMLADESVRSASRGAELLSGVSFLDGVADVVRGLPVTGDDSGSMVTRIVRAADRFDVLVSGDGLVVGADRVPPEVTGAAVQQLRREGMAAEVCEALRSAADRRTGGAV